ncbi:peptide/opine/nickel uptake family ABC transporter, permease/ATP-binding protein [Treponema primitia ZAS-2]|uniref:Peptide/opine/nickel uptake family ABC transporter, permease/ATP-binding protein n=1 Tax=Treponema primitia (strain ATCC BAA-887 / DSM 12427 / ZAS-2) TaxID=545694 RepID=F5YPG8_TREPZ|nr:dipeptide/oligopeptide/nickel ABC transporter permease/ATP-binding protein [Treponema primitia]AEF84113.1 peptide/opine/nickel uptake family ABC transporter, permease/ATP-binding protein [Treponema primitia ZAS-2]
MKRFLNYLKARPLGLVSLIVILFLYLVMIFAEFVAPYKPTTTFGSMTYHPPNLHIGSEGPAAQEARVINSVNWKYARVRGAYHGVRFLARGEPYKLWGLIPAERHLFTTGPAAGLSGTYPIFILGADHLGRDLFSRIVYGSRISLTIGFIATAISLFLSMLLGGLSGFFGGLTDWTVMRFSEFFMLIPGLYLILFLRSLLSSTMDSGQSYMMITIILSLVGWPGSARTIRGMVHAIKREEFVMNAHLEMIPSPVIILGHIIPQIASLLIVSIALSVPGFIMTETTLSYLGLGIVDPAVSWGSLIRRDISTISNLRNFPWLLSPVWALLAVTLGFNFLGDALRDYYDPYHTVFRGRRLFKRRTPKDESAVALHTGTGILAREPAVQNTGPDGSETAPQHNGAPISAPLLAVKDLSVSFTVLRGNEAVSVQAVRGVSFTLERGEILGIVGESGSGKSVTTQAIPGLLPESAVVNGSIKYEGEEIINLETEKLRSYRGRKIGMIFQEPGRSYDPLQNMGSVFLETFRNSDPAITREAALKKAAALLNETGLPNGRERLSNFPHQFSGGQLQRIGIALALAQSCELLIADEPTTALDVTIQAQIVDLLKTLRKTRRISIIFISHDIDLVADISDRIMVMYGGLVMESGPSKAFTAAAQVVATGPANAVTDGTHRAPSSDVVSHPYTKALLAASPRFGTHYSGTRLISIPGKVSDPARPEPGCPFAPRCPEAQHSCAGNSPTKVGVASCAQDIPSLRSLLGDRVIRCVLHSEKAGV